MKLNISPKGEQMDAGKVVKIILRVLFFPPMVVLAGLADGFTAVARQLDKLYED